MFRPSKIRTGILFTIVFLFSFSFTVSDPDKIRNIQYQGKAVKTTFDVDDSFIGRYSGKKSGFLELKKDGTGVYRYDVFAMMTKDNCPPESITMEWGFLLDEELNIVKFQREYGHSYPVLFRSTGKTHFKGCQDEVMLDFIMVYKDGSIGVSSSDDWKNTK